MGKQDAPAPGTGGDAGGNASRGETRRVAILDAAARLICLEGVHAASISEIGKASRSSAGSIYHHFSNKLEIVLAVAHRFVAEPMRARLDAHGDDQLSPGDMFREIVGMVATGELDSALIVQLWAGSSTEPQLKEMLYDQMSDLRRVMTGYIEAWLARRGLPDAAAAAEGIALVTVGQAMGLLAQRTLVPGLDADRYLEAAAVMLDHAADAFARQGSGGRATAAADDQ